MNICIDARLLLEKKSGIGFYIENVLNYMVENDDENEYYLISDRKILYDDIDKIHKCLLPGIRWIPGTFSFEFGMNRFLRDNHIQCDIFWGTQHFVPVGLPKTCCVVLTIHDLTYKIYPNLVDSKNLIMQRIFTPYSIERADKIICVSNYSFKMLKYYYEDKIRTTKTKVIYPSGNLEKDGKALTDEELKVISELKQSCYILFIGNIEPRKNLSVLLDAYNMIKNEIPFKLVICGRYGWKNRMIFKRIQKDAAYLEYVSGSMKKELLRNAFVVVLPSTYEGFGVPIVEAMQMGTVVISSRNSSMEELIEDDNLKFDTDNAGDLADKITLLYRNAGLYQEAKGYCMRRGKDFSWDKAGSEHYKFMLG